MKLKNPIGKIKKVPLREIWKREDKEFTIPNSTLILT